MRDKMLCEGAARVSEREIEENHIEKTTFFIQNFPVTGKLKEEKFFTSKFEIFKRDALDYRKTRRIFLFLLGV